MNYIVTGGAGFIGSHLSAKLIELGHQVLILDNLSSGDIANIPKGAIYLDWDIADFNTGNEISFIRQLTGGEAIHGIFHLAAESRIQPSIKDPKKCVMTNIVGTMNVLELMRAASIRNIVYSASSSSYGLKNKSPLTEDMIADCLTPYAVSKYAGEELCKTWGKLYNINNVCLKYFNVYGERSPVGIGAYSPVIGLFFKQALRDHSDLTVVGDGSQRRDFTYVGDVVEANVLAMQNLENKSTANGETINIGTGKNYTILEIANMILERVKHYRPKTSIAHIESRLGEAKETLADTQKAKELLNWTAKTSIIQALDGLLYYYLSPCEEC